MSELLTPTLSERLINVNAYALVISFEDVESSTRYQQEYVKNIKPEGTRLSILDTHEAGIFWERIYTAAPKDLGFGMPNIAGGLTETIAVLKIGIVNMKVIDLARECQLLSDTYSVNAEAHGGLGTGVCQVILRGVNVDVEQGITHLRTITSRLGGYAIVKHLPVSLHGKVDVWGEKPSYYGLMKEIKTKMDPNKILNPNRYIGGI